MGAGHHRRIDEVLKIWMYGRLSQLIRGPDRNDLFGPDGLFATEKPQWDEAYDAEEKVLDLVRSFGRGGGY
jgi:hypothetical protein